LKKIPGKGERGDCGKDRDRVRDERGGAKHSEPRGKRYAGEEGGSPGSGSEPRERTAAQDWRGLKPRKARVLRIP